MNEEEVHEHSHSVNNLIVKAQRDLIRFNSDIQRAAIASGYVVLLVQTKDGFGITIYFHPDSSKSVKEVLETIVLNPAWSGEDWNAGGNGSTGYV